MSLDAVDPEHLFIRGVVTGNLAGYLAGRTKEIEGIANRLAASDQSCVIFGERGAGKTTVARQVISLLSGSNLVFGKNSSLMYGTEKEFRPFMARVSEDMETAGDLLLECVTSDNGPDSFVEFYKQALTSEAFLVEFSVKFGFNIAKVFTGEAGGKFGVKNALTQAQKDGALQTSERIKRRIFQEFVNRARSSDDARDPKIIFFLDEVDRRPSLLGLGQAVKDINDVQFCFVGIADTIDEIISEHESAGRKLTGGGFKVPALSDDEIDWIFDNATHISGDAVKFTRDLRDKVIEYAEGMPWIAQHVGFEMVFANLGPARKRGDIELKIGIEAFRPAMRAAIDVYRTIFNEKYDIEKTIGDTGLTGPEVLKILLKSKVPLSEVEIKSSFSSDQQKLKRWVPNVISTLVESGVVIQKGSSFSFRSALLRIFTRYFIDELEALD